MIEFALVAPLFLALVFSTFEAGWIMTKGALLERALDQTMRLVRIGGQDAPTTQSGIKAQICQRVLVVPNCIAATTVEMIEIRTAADFPTRSAVCVDGGGGIVPVVSFTPGARSSIMFVRVCVAMDLFTPFIGIALGLPKDSTGRYNQITTSAFMNEPSTLERRFHL